MARLFISLYVFITLALIGLSAGLEQLFDVSSVEDNTHSLALSAVLEEAREQELDLLKLLHASQLDTQVLARDAIAWPQAVKDTLAIGKAVTLYDAEIGEQVFIQVSNNQILQLNLGRKADQSPSFFLYSSVFFVLLALLIALWIWPLWRDLRALEHSVTELNPDGTLGANKIKKSSLIGPIANAINLMSQKIKTLMQSQRELSGAVAHLTGCHGC